MAMVKNDISLNELISDAFYNVGNNRNFGRNKDEREREAAKLKTWFERYYGGLSDKNDKKKEELVRDILDKTLSWIKMESNNFFTYIIDGLNSYPRDKYKQALCLKHLLCYINEKHSTHFDLEFAENYNQPDKSVRLLEILKLLHTNNISKSDIADAFRISERALNNDLNALHDGIEFMGAKMQIREFDNENGKYISPNHPIFLTLNSPEVYAMTIGLKLLSENTVFQYPHTNIADQIYSQLSDFGRNMVDKKAAELGIEFEDTDRKFVCSADFVLENNRAFCQYLRDSRLCAVQYMEDNIIKCNIGSLHINRRGPERYCKIILRTIEGDLLIDIKNIKQISPYS